MGRRTAVNAARGALLAAGVALVFVGELLGLQLVGRTAGDTGSLGATARTFGPPLLAVGLPAGALLGVLASRLRRRRLTWLILGSLVAAVLAAVATMLVMARAPIPLREAPMLVAVAAWSVFAYGLLLGPPLLLALVALERWTRPPPA